MSVYYIFFKQKAAYEMRISDWSSDVCSSDLRERQHAARQEVLASDLHDAGTDPVPLLQRLRGAALGYSKWLVALDQVAHKEAAPGLDLADFVEAHHRRSKGTQVDFGRAALVDRTSTRLNSSH